MIKINKQGLKYPISGSDARILTILNRWGSSWYSLSSYNGSQDEYNNVKRLKKLGYINMYFRNERASIKINKVGEKVLKIYNT